MCDVWPFSVRVCVPVTASQRRMVPLPSPLASVCPSGLDATLVTSVLCPSSVQRCAPVTASQIRMVSSPLPLASVRAIRAKGDTLVMSAACPSRCPLLHTRRNIPKTDVGVAHAETSTRQCSAPSGLNARLDLAAGLYAMRRDVRAGPSAVFGAACLPWDSTVG